MHRFRYASRVRTNFGFIAWTVAALAINGCSMSVGVVTDVPDVGPGPDTVIIVRDVPVVQPDIQDPPDIVIPIVDGGMSQPLGAPCMQDGECASHLCVRSAGL